jgi:hypothetical protein
VKKNEKNEGRCSPMERADFFIIPKKGLHEFKRQIFGSVQKQDLGTKQQNNFNNELTCCCLIPQNFISLITVHF